MRRTMLKLSTKKTGSLQELHIRVFWSIMGLILPLSSSTYSIYIKGLDSPPSIMLMQYLNSSISLCYEAWDCLCWKGRLNTVV